MKPMVGRGVDEKGKGKTMGYSRCVTERDFGLRDGRWAALEDVTGVAYRDLDTIRLSRGTEQDAKSRALRNFEIRLREGRS
jgi:hypothetical protein